MYKLISVSSVCRLSERNCIEIVQCLVELKLLEVIHTTDGKEYLTPNELAKEIREELTVRGGTVDHCVTVLNCVLPIRVRTVLVCGYWVVPNIC